MTNPLRLTDLDMEVARRKLKRKIAAAIISAMAETDADYEFMAKRLRTTPDKVAKEIDGFIRGETKAMDEASDLALAVGAELSFGITRYEAPRRPVDAAEEKKD